MSRALSSALVLVGRELGAFFLSPVGAVVGAAFLAVQGLSFWGLVSVLSDPEVNAPRGAVLSSFFGGTVIHWAVLFALASALTMRLIAEERRAGTWETLCTSGISDVAITLGKWTSAYLVYLALWLPTLLFVVFVNVFAASDASIELGPIVSAYLGVAVVGAAVISIGFAASAATDNQMVAALLSFAVAMVLLLIGEITDFGLSARADMFEFASGLVRPRSVAVYLGAALVVALLGHAAIALGRRKRGEIVRRLALVGVTAAAAAAVGVLGGRLDGIDLTSSRVHTLEPETEAVLDRVSSPVEIAVLEPTIPGFAEVFETAARVARRFARAQPLIRVRVLDPAASSSDINALAREFGVAAEPLAQGGAVVIKSGGRRRLLDVTAVASFGADSLGAGQVASFWAESAFSQAIAEVTDSRIHVACFASDVGGLLTRDTGDGGLDWSKVGELLTRDGVAVRATPLSADLDSCDALVIAGPTRTIDADRAIAVQKFARRGGGLLYAVRSELRDAKLSGLELVLAELGVTVDQAIVVDPRQEVGVGNLWVARDTYADHPITRAFGQRNVETHWLAPRAVNAPEGVALVSGSLTSWAESDVAAVLSGAPIEAGEGERLGSVPVAAALTTPGGGRVVALGSAETAATQFVARGLGAGHILASRAIRWLVGRDVDVPITDKAGEHVRLELAGSARSATMIICVAVIPLLWLVLFGAIAWRRQRG